MVKGLQRRLLSILSFSIIQGKLKTYISLCGDKMLTLITLSVRSLIMLYAIFERKKGLQFVFNATKFNCIADYIVMNLFKSRICQYIGNKSWLIFLRFDHFHIRLIRFCNHHTRTIIFSYFL